MQGEKLPRRRIAAEIELLGGSRMTVMLFISPQGRVLDMLNDGRGFLPLETEAGEVFFIRKDAIRSVVPVSDSKDHRKSNDGQTGRYGARANSHPIYSEPYELLGISPDASLEEIREAYHERCRENHPDQLQALGLPREYIDLATQRMAQINAAYDRLKEVRKAIERRIAHLKKSQTG
jgi:hypothetical protein